VLDFLMQPGAAIVCAGILGLVVGSFLNVVILRLPARLLHAWREQSRELLDLPPAASESTPPGLVWEPSHCPHCKHRLGALENIPLLSWLALRGRCRHCRAPISIQYPAVELLTGLCSAAVIWKFGLDWPGGAGLVLTWMLIALSGIDLRTQLLPDQLTLPLLWLGLLLSVFAIFVGSAASILGAALGYLSLWSVYWLFKLATGKEGMGYGDFKLLGALGAWMGPYAILPIVLLSSLAGAIIGSLFLAMRGRDRATPIPFGPFIAAAGWVWLLLADPLTDLYQDIFSLL
jgi:leader peptidase (prepilin peptidase)/N-methyltransferase